MPRLRVSDTEYYTVRRRRGDNGIYFILSPYSCMSPISFYLDQISRQISIFLRNRAIYKGIADLSRIKEELERMDELNPVELVTILNVLYKEPDTRGYVTGRMSPIDRVIYSWAYESSEELKRMIEEAMNSMDPDKLLTILESVWDRLPENLKREMGRKYKPLIKDKERRPSGPWIEYPPPPWLRKKKKKRVVAYA
jgi:hypothetical protein